MRHHAHCLGHLSAISISGFREEKLVQNVHTEQLPGQHVLGMAAWLPEALLSV